MQKPPTSNQKRVSDALLSYKKSSFCSHILRIRSCMSTSHSISFPSLVIRSISFLAIPLPSFHSAAVSVFVVEYASARTKPAWGIMFIQAMFQVSHAHPITRPKIPISNDSPPLPTLDLLLTLHPAPFCEVVAAASSFAPVAPALGSLVPVPVIN